MTTIRALMLAQQARHELAAPPRDKCVYCGQTWPCADRVAADAVITELYAAGVWPVAYQTGGQLKAHWQPTHRIVPDPEAS